MHNDDKVIVDLHCVENKQVVAYEYLAGTRIDFTMEDLTDYGQQILLGLKKVDTMNNANLVKALRCKSNDINNCTMCDYHNACYGGTLAEIAADALEEDEKRIVDCVAAINALDDSNDAYIKENERLKKRIAELSLDNKMLRNTIDADKGVMLDRIHFLEAQSQKEGECEAKKPKTVKETEYSFYCDCPTCGGRLISNLNGEWYAGSFDRFCRMCGQKIDWSEYCGWSNKPYCGTKMNREQ